MTVGESSLVDEASTLNDEVSSSLDQMASLVGENKESISEIRQTKRAVTEYFAAASSLTQDMLEGAVDFTDAASLVSQKNQLLEG